MSGLMKTSTLIPRDNLNKHRHRVKSRQARRGQLFHQHNLFEHETGRLDPLIPTHLRPIRQAYRHGLRFP